MEITASAVRGAMGGENSQPASYAGDVFKSVWTALKAAIEELPERGHTGFAGFSPRRARCRGSRRSRRARRRRGPADGGTAVEHQVARRADVGLHVHRHGVVGHPVAHRVMGGVEVARERSQDVALGEDPVARPSSITSAEPTWRPPISVAASATVAVGSTATRSLLMMSRTVVMPPTKPSRRRLGREALRAWYAPRRGAYLAADARPVRDLGLGGDAPADAGGPRRPAVPFVPAPLPRSARSRRAPRRDVVAEWGGLGYNRGRFRFSEAARAIVKDHGGSRAKDELLELPGSACTRPPRWPRWGSANLSPSSTPTCGEWCRVHLGIEGHEAPARRCGRLPTRGWIGRSRDVEPSRDGSRREVCRPKPHRRDAPARPRLPVPPLGIDRATGRSVRDRSRARPGRFGVRS